MVKYLISKYDSIMEVKDSLGNTALHVAAYKGHLAVVEALINESPPLVSVVNNDGDTFLHMVVSGFAASGFKRLDRQMELLKKLILGGGRSCSVDFSEIVNVRNGYGRTVIHLAVMDNYNAVRSDVVESLLRIHGVDLNVVDSDGMTAVDLLERQTPRTPVSDLLIKRLKSAGGRSNGGENVSRLREERYGFCGSPGTSFDISDSEIFLFTAARTDQTAANGELSPNRESFDGISECSSEISTHSKRKRLGGSTGARLKLLLRWAKREESEENRRFSGDNNNRRVPLREMYSRSRSPSEIDSRGRAFPMRTESGDLPSLSVRLKFTEGLMKGVVVQESPRFVFSPPVASDYSRSSACSSPLQTFSSELKRRTPAMKKQGSFMNRYLCFGGAGLAIDGSSEMSNGSAHRLRHQSFKRVMSLVS